MTPKIIVSALDPAGRRRLKPDTTYGLPAMKSSAFTKAMGAIDVDVARHAVRTLMERVLAEYAEMPGLSVTLPQAQRLWAVDRATCEEVFSRLVARRVLTRTTQGRFVRV